MAFPPYFRTTVGPWNRSSHGSASASDGGLGGQGASGRIVGLALMSRTPSSRGRRRAVRSLVQTVAVAVAGTRSTSMLHRAAGQVDEVAVLAGWHRPADPDAVDRDVEGVGLEGRRGRSRRAARIRPQFGSSPWIAHLKRLLRAMARPTSTASSSVAALTTSMRCPCRRPPRRPPAGGPGAQTSVTRGSSSGGGRDAGCAAGEQQDGVVGGHAAVGVDRSKVTRVAARSAGPAVAASATASVVSTTSMVASAGRACRRPWPCRRP